MMRVIWEILVVMGNGDRLDWVEGERKDSVKNSIDASKLWYLGAEH